MAKQLIAILVVASAAVLRGDSLQAQATDRTATQRLAEANTTDLAIMLAANGLSGGFVVRLPENLSGTLAAIKTRTDLTKADRGAFAVWVKDSSLPVTDNRFGPVSSTAEEALRAYARSRPRDGWVVAKSAPTGIDTLTANSATTCRQALQGKFEAPVTGRVGEDKAEIVSRLVRTATGATTPGGFIGSCLATGQSLSEPFIVEAGETLQEALNRVAARFAGTVWVAVQAPTSECSLGLLQQREGGGGVCVTPITSHLGRP